MALGNVSCLPGCSVSICWRCVDTFVKCMTPGVPLARDQPLSMVGSLGKRVVGAILCSSAAAERYNLSSQSACQLHHLLAVLCCAVLHCSFHSWKPVCRGVCKASGTREGVKRQMHVLATRRCRVLVSRRSQEVSECSCLWF